MTVTSLAFNPPEIPSKWDIIPIHNSDRGNFKRCRRYWNWSSPARQNLSLRADVHGVVPHLWFGTGIHWALEQYYTPGLRRDPVESWKTWYDIQWRGGIVTEYWLDKVYDLRPQLITNPQPYNSETYVDIEAPQDTYRVRGLEDIIPSPNRDEFDELYMLGIEMMTFYKEYSEKYDDFQVILTEHDFSVPIWDYENSKILTAMDIREDSPNHGKYLEVHARGRIDNVYQSVNGYLGIIDYKTAGSIKEEYFEKLDTDEQCTSYLWALETEAKYYKLPHAGQPIEEVLYVALRKAYPKPPTMLTSGMFSISRTDESTTVEMLDEFIKTHMGNGLIPLSDKQQSYYDYVKESGDEQFIIRRPVRRNRHQIANAGRRIYQEAMDMLSNPRIYPNISNDYLCLRCQFRAPCIASEDGGDVEQLIRDNYTSSRDR